MALAVCKSCVPPALLGLDGGGGVMRCGERAFCASPAVMSPETWLAPQEDIVAKEEEVGEKRDTQLDIWSSIQSPPKPAAAAADEVQTPYVHPLMRRSSSLSQKSLEICTESLGSETGSDGFSSEDLEDYFSSKMADEVNELVSETEEEEEVAGDGNGGYASWRHQGRRKELSTVNYHCSTGRRSPPRLFPPPLPSISRRDGPCLHMRPHRRDGRLVVEAVPVPSQNYLHAQRQGGRLLLNFINPSFGEIYPETEDPVFLEQQEEEEGEGEESQESDREEAYADEEDNLIEEDADEMGEEEGEEEVEVVDRGIVVEVKVSRQPQLQSGGGKKVHRSSLVINKFVGGTPLSSAEKRAEEEKPRRGVAASSGSMCSITTTTTAAVAVAAASSSSSAEPSYWGTGGKGPQQGQQKSSSSPDKLYFTSKKLMNRQALLHQVRRCSESHRPLFFWEPCCIATT